MGRSMFEGSYFLGNIKKFNVEKVESMQGMFYYSNFGFSYYLGKAEQNDLNGWKTSSVTNMAAMFGSARYFKDLPLKDWDVSSVTTMYGMFFNSTFNEPIDVWNVANVQNMSYMF